MASYDELVELGYRDLQMLGQGGFGTVYGADDPTFGRRVALKVIETRLDDDAGRRFERERRAVAALPPHPHIVTVYSIARTNSGMPVFVMELVTGGTLAEQVGTVSWQDAFTFGAQLSGALETAHRAGVIHRDVKPDNVLLGNYGEAKLSDFGIATLTGTSTTTAAVTATLSHAAPEILSGRPATPSSDVYSLASTLFTVIAGQPPFVSGPGGMPELIARITTQPPPTLASYGVPGSAAAVLERALAKDPADRPASAAEFGEQLTAALRAAGVDAPALAIAGPAAPVHGGAPAADPTGSETVIGRRGRATPVMPVPTPPPGHGRRRIVAIAVAAVAAVAAAGVAIAQPWQHGTRPSAQGAPVPSASSSSSPSPGSTATHKPSPRKPATKPPVVSPSATSTVVVVVTQPPGSTATSASNHNPALGAVAAQTTNELTAVSLRLVGSDADHNALHYSLSGSLPAGLSLNSSTGVISGTISVSAASVTAKYSAIKTRVFPLTATVSDGHATASRSFTWTVRDTALVMPNYFNAYGCGSTCSGSAPNDAGKPNISYIASTHGTTCTSTQPAGITGTGKIVSQSIAAGTTIKWGTYVVYKYYPCSP